MLAVIANIQAEEFDAARTLRYNQWETLARAHHHWPHRPQIIEIIRQNFAIAWIMIVICRKLCNLSGGGIGAMLYRYNRYNDLRTTLGFANRDTASRHWHRSAASGNAEAVVSIYAAYDLDGQLSAIEMC